MRTPTLLRQLLMSFCRSTTWKYAVFWKLKHHSRMLLTWEDGYCENSEPRSGLFSITPGYGSSGCKTGMQSESSVGCPIAEAVEHMASHLYSLGDGIIGSVASTEKYYWIIVNQVDSKSLLEYPEEWQFQIAAGIKTILLVPVPHGVVQLGSLETIAEDCMVVARIQELFHFPQDNFGTFRQILSSRVVNPIPATSHIRKFSAPLAVTGSLQTHCRSQVALNIGTFSSAVEQVHRVEKSDIDHMVPRRTLSHDGSPQGETGIQKVIGADANSYEDLWKSLCNSIAVVSHRDSQVLDQRIGNDGAFSFDCKNSVHEDVTQYNYETGGVLQEATGLQFAQYDNFYDVDELFQPLENEVLEESDSLTFPVNTDLDDNVWPPFFHGHDDCAWDATLGRFWLSDNYSVACQTEELDCHKLQPTDFNGFVINENEAAYFLDAVVASPNYTSNENTLHVSNFVRSPSNSSEQFLGSCLTQSKYESNVMEAVQLGSPNNENSGFVSSSEGLMSSPTRSSSKSGGWLLNEDMHDKAQTDEPCKIKKSAQTGKKSQRGGDIHKPRPRDRQLIQDRVKELRELVPNAAKCSIDSLLDRTIRHMLFLRSVSSQADKLKNCAYMRISGKTDSTAPKLLQNEATWAYELGTEPELCPLLVENMDQPGYLLVEMLCTEYGDFLEIAHVIRHSELTILKGIMEKRFDKLWARFIVEASRGFDRMDILWPLMRLMQKSGCPIKSKF